jgi:hypothetical protein
MPFTTWMGHHPEPFGVAAIGPDAEGPQASWRNRRKQGVGGKSGHGGPFSEDPGQDLAHGPPVRTGGPDLRSPSAAPVAGASCRAGPAACWAEMTGARPFLRSGDRHRIRASPGNHVHPMGRAPRVGRPWTGCRILGSHHPGRGLYPCDRPALQRCQFEEPAAQCLWSRLLALLSRYP